MEDPRIISALFIFLKMAYYNVLINIIIHSDCDDMYDVARYYIEETGALGEVPASLQNYIDYQAYGRDLDLSGTFISTNHGIFEIVY